MKSKYKIQTELDQDKHQFKLCEKGIKPNTSLLAEVTTLNYNQNVFCPFCLHKDSLRKFIKNKRLGKCPECESGMLIRTLLEMLKWTPEEYAEFVYKYPYPAFWQKCKFQTWKQRLYHLNMSNEFWLIYKHLKEQNADNYYPQDTEEDYERFKEKMKQKGIDLE